MQILWLSKSSNELKPCCVYFRISFIFCISSLSATIVSWWI